MRSLSLLGRLGLPAVLTGLALVMAGPAVAAPSTPPSAEPAPPGRPELPDFPWLSVDQPWLVNIAGGHKTVPVVVTNYSDVAASGVTVRIDASDVTGAFTVALPGAAQGCVVTGKVAECTVAELAASAGKTFPVDVGPGSDDEGSGRITVTVTAAGLPGEEATETLLERAEPGVDMVIAGIDDLKLRPGRSAPVPVVVKNEGDVAADGTVVVIATSPYIDLPNPYSNCEREEEFQTMYCIFDTPLPPGAVFTIDPSTPLTVEVAADAPGPYDYPAFVAAVPDSFLEEEFAAKVAKKPGTELRLVPAVSASAEELNDFDNATDFAITVPRTDADTAAIGATVTGAVGDTSTIEVGVRNDGPSDTLLYSPEHLLTAYVTLPAAVTAQKVPGNCVPVGDDGPDYEHGGRIDGSNYLCFPEGPMDKGAEITFRFTVTITGTETDAGAVYVDGGVQDANDRNDVAPIALDITAAGGGDGGAGGSLPITGAPAAVIAGGGALLLIGGAAAFVVARRRRIVTVVE